MTKQGPIRIDPDGTRHYARGPSYKPKPGSRPYGRNRPEHPDAVLFHALWFEPLVVLDTEQRVMPRTRPDEEGIPHRLLCVCQFCKDNSWVLKQKRKRLGLRS